MEHDLVLPSRGSALSRMQRFEDAMNQVLVYTAGRGARWFRSLSAMFR